MFRTRSENVGGVGCRLIRIGPFLDHDARGMLACVAEMRMIRRPEHVDVFIDLMPQCSKIANYYFYYHYCPL